MDFKKIKTRKMTPLEMAEIGLTPDAALAAKHRYKQERKKRGKSNFNYRVSL